MNDQSQTPDDPLPNPLAPFAEVTKADESTTDPQWEPHIDIGETPGSYVVVAEMPGVRSEHLNLIYENGFLTIDAQAPQKGYEQWKSIIQDERDKGRCYRVFALPPDIDVEGRRETLHQGLLTIHLPKLATAAVQLHSLDRKTEQDERPLPKENREQLTEFPHDKERKLGV